MMSELTPQDAQADNATLAGLMSQEQEQDDEELPDWLSAAADELQSMKADVVPSCSKPDQPTSASLNRAVTAEAECTRLRSELRSLTSEAARKQELSNQQLAEARARLATTAKVSKAGDEENVPPHGHGGGAGADQRARALSKGILGLDEKMSLMEAEVEKQRLTIELSSCQAELDASARRLGRQERIVSKLMQELREEKLRLAARSGTADTLERLKAELLVKVHDCAEEVRALRESVTREVSAASSRVSSSASSEERRAAGCVEELEASAAASRLAEVAAFDELDRSEAREAAL